MKKRKQLQLLKVLLKEHNFEISTQAFMIQLLNTKNSQIFKVVSLLYKAMLLRRRLYVTFGVIIEVFATVKNTHIKSTMHGS